MPRRAQALSLLAACALVLTASACGGDAGADTEARTAATTRPTTTVAAPTTTTPPPTTAAPASGLPGDDDPAAAAPRAPAARPRPLTVTGRIEIPKIGLVHTTYEGIELSVIDHGPSHWPGTAMPGQPGNTVFAGHRVTHSHPFLDIDRVAVGDQVIFTNDSGRFVYEVTQTLVVGPKDLWIADPTPGTTFTIFGCHPKGSARQRYVVRGRLASSGGTTPAAGAPAVGQTAPTAPAATTTTTTPCLLCGLLGK
ncbi:MAG: sortase [Acidimicrobiales bacterium]